MSDSRRQYRAIKEAMKQLYPEEPRGNLARHLETLVGMISGIIGSKSCQLPKMASRVPGDVHPDSRVKQFSRWVQNENVTFELYFLPFVQSLLERLAAVRPRRRRQKRPHYGLTMVLVVTASGCHSRPADLPTRSGSYRRRCTSCVSPAGSSGSSLPRIAWLLLGHRAPSRHLLWLNSLPDSLMRNG